MYRVYTASLKRLSIAAKFVELVSWPILENNLEVVIHQLEGLLAFGWPESLECVVCGSHAALSLSESLARSIARLGYLWLDAPRRSVMILLHWVQLVGDVA